jgi:histidinol phosphatase-like PHP family hydrolase
VQSHDTDRAKERDFVNVSIVDHAQHELSQPSNVPDRLHEHFMNVFDRLKTVLESNSHKTKNVHGTLDV